ncbi:MAG TPA: ABC transporter substrate-binding protein [Patescibacteria group bacterium]|nr:ABC transporter substrate-binding protein [Patescibacteria group bacterium]
MSTTSGKRSFLPWILCAAIVIAGFAIWRYVVDSGWNADRDASRPPVLRFGYNASNANHGPLMVAIEKGLFEKQGVAVKLFPFRRGRDITQALGAGQIDVATGALSGFIAAIAQGAPVKIIAMCTVGQTVVYVRPGETVKTLVDLKGKRIGMGRTTGGSGLHFQSVLQRNGLSLETDMEYVNTSREQAAMALMMHRTIDAYVTHAYFESKLEEIGAIPLPGWESEGYLREMWPRTSVAVRSDFLNEQADVIERFLAGYIEAHLFVRENPGEAASIIARHITEKCEGVVTFTREEVEEAWASLKYVVPYDTNHVRNLAHISHQLGLVDADLPAEMIVDDRFLNYLKGSMPDD